MSITLFSERQRSAVQELVELSAERARVEAEIAAAYQARDETTEAEFAQAQQTIQEILSTAQEAAVREFRATTLASTDRYEEQHSDTTREFSAAKLRANSEHEADVDTAQGEYKESRWTIGTVFEADKKVAKDQLVKLQRRVGVAVQRIEAAHEEAMELIRKWQLEDTCAAVDVKPRSTKAEEDPVGALKRCTATVQEQLEGLEELSTPTLARGPRLFYLLILGWLVLLTPVLLFPDYWFIWVPATTLAVGSVGFVLRLWLSATLRHQVLKLYVPMQEAFLAREALQKRCLDEGQAAYHVQIEEAKKKNDAAVLQATRDHKQFLQDRQKQRERGLRAADEKYQPALDRLTQRRDRDLRQAEERYQRAMSESTTTYEADLHAATTRHDGLLEDSKTTFVNEWQALAAKWKRGLTSFQSILQGVASECDRLFPDWKSPVWSAWPSPKVVPAGMRFGELRVNLEMIPDGVPQDERLHALGHPDLSIPALLPFPEHGSLLLKVKDEGRARAVQLLQDVMMRAVTGIPPAKARFTIIDPVGLGENFAAFAHLADYDEQLVTSRIWTEPPHIEQRLADLTEHIENVIQKYLRNQFETLEEYNAQAGEVAEPYRFLVVANFPANFTNEAARRLVSIATSGARCGIQTLISVDTKQPLPQHFDLADLERGSTVLLWKDGRFQWRDEDFARFPLTLEEPPAAEQCTTLLQMMGQRAKDASRVEVPFKLIAPPAEQWWTGDSRSGLRVPLGRAGATKKQYLDLGKGTSQHVLIAGKTGSGKSTVLHALITIIGLYYRPDEVELYLIDFKKGVEFKNYANYELPHARVIAVESEREFGLSVLQRLDGELRQRGEMFRALGVNDLAGYRQATNKPLPRVMLIVDEFQEFFVEDDKIAQETALLLDRLVRQGRAFGIHVMLGSQTLGGAFSLARSTIDQMAVRIALQCSEADGHLILSKENSAARLLSRPGEAIYNDANGMVEGNNLFQVVWLSDEQRDESLTKVQDMVRERGFPTLPQIVFEGNAPAHLNKNHLLVQMLEAPDWPPPATGYTAWLGEAIAIKDPTAAIFRRQSGANLLMVGQQAEAALNILTGAVVSLAAQQAPEPDGKGGMRFYWVGDPAAEVSGEAVFERLPQVLPQPLRTVTWRELPEVLGELGAEVDRRHKDRENAAAPLFLFIYGLQRFRDLRKQEDDFGFGRRGEEKQVHPSKLFANIIREGPPVGVFTLLWCDTTTNLNRSVDRQGLREFEMRVLFQMSANDSSNLIDSPVAAKVGPHRALYFSEDQGKVEKFRPYGFPSEGWLEWLKERLRRQSAAEAV